MGIIQRQGIKQSIVNYFGVAIGVISSVFIYPNDRETYGLAQFILGTAQFFAPILILGAHVVNVRFFPTFRNEEKGHHGILGFTSLIVLGGCSIFIISFVLFREYIYDWYGDKDPLLLSYLDYIVPIACLIAFSQLFIAYCSNFKRIVVPSIIFNLSIKVILPVLVILYFLGKIPLDWLVYGLIINYVLTIPGLLYYIYSLKQWHWKIDWSFLTKPRVKEIKTYALYGSLMAMGSVMAFRIDSFMVASLIDTASNGTYNISLFIGNAIAIPSIAIIQIAGPIVTDSFQKKDYQHIDFIYKQSSINLLLVGLYLFVGVLLCTEDLYELMPGDGGVKEGFFVVVFIGLAKLVDMATSINNQIINFSSKYKFGLYAIFILAISNVIFNLWLIPLYGITGAAMATFISIVVYNVAKLIYIYTVWKMQPFTLMTLKALVIAVAAYFVVSLIPLPEFPILRILIKGGIYTILFIPTILYLEISNTLNEMLISFYNKHFSKK